MGVRRNLAVLLLCLGVSHVAPADEPGLDPGALRRDLAAIIPRELEDRHLPGAVIVAPSRVKREGGTRCRRRSPLLSVDSGRPSIRIRVLPSLLELARVYALRVR